MEFSKHKAGILTALLCLVVIVAVIWFCLSGMTQKKTPEGVLVEHYIQEVIL